MSLHPDGFMSTRPNDILVWVTAYFSGLNVGLPRNHLYTGQIADHLDSEGVIAWMDKYCDGHPLETIQVAANKLYYELANSALVIGQGATQQLPAGESDRDSLQQQLAASQAETEEQKRLRAESELQIEMLNAQLLTLRQQLARLVTALDASEAKAKADDVQIVDLGKRLNDALVSKVEAAMANKCPP